MTFTRVEKKKETLLSYSFLPIDVLLLTPMNKTLLDMSLNYFLIRNITFITYALIQSLFTPQEYTLEDMMFSDCNTTYTITRDTADTI